MISFLLIMIKCLIQIESNETIDLNNIIPNDTAKWFGLELTSNLDQFIRVNNNHLVKLNKILETTINFTTIDLYNIDHYFNI